MEKIRELEAEIARLESTTASEITELNKHVIRHVVKKSHERKS